MTWAITETPIRSLATYIGTAAAAKLANIEDRSEYSGIEATLADFAEIRFHEPPMHPEPAYPVLYLRPLRARLKPGPGGIAKGFIGSYDIMVAVICASGEGPDMALSMVQRYMVGVVEMIAEYWNGTTRPYEWAMVSDPEILYEPLYTSNSGEFFADARMLISTQVREAAL